MDARLNTEISSLPNEMLENIFLNILKYPKGLKYLLKTKNTCKRWKTIIDERILNNKTIEYLWYIAALFCLPRNAVLEFLNIGTSRFRGSDRSCLLRAIINRRAPVLDTLNRIRYVEIKYEDGCLNRAKSQWNELVLNHMIINWSGNNLAKESRLHQKTNYISIDIETFGIVTSIKLTGEMIISGHSHGLICFWNLKGNLLHSTKMRDIKSIVSLNLIDAYKKGPYCTNYIKGQIFTIDHHAFASLSCNGSVYLWTLNVSTVTHTAEESRSSECCWNLKCLIRKDSIPDVNWKVNYVRVFGDAMIVVYDETKPFALFNYEETKKKIMILRFDTREELSSSPNKLPEVLSYTYLNFKIGHHRLLPGDCCNLWYLPGSYAWQWQCIKILHHTGRLYMCFLPNEKDNESSHRYIWKEYAPSSENKLAKLNNLVLRLEDKGVMRESSHASLHIIFPKCTTTKTENETRKSYSSSSREVIIDGKKFLILDNNETYKAFQVQNYKLAYLHDKIKTCYVFRDDVYIIITIANELLVSVDGLFYRHYTRSDFECFENAHVSACYFIMNLLIIGTSNGSLKGYTVPKSSDLLQLDFDKPSWTEKVATESEIKNIDVGFINSACAVTILTIQENNLITVIHRKFDTIK